LRYISDDLKKDKHVVMTAICTNPLALQYVQDEWGSDVGMVIAAVSRNTYSLRYASSELQDNHCVVFAALRKNGYSGWDDSLSFASDRVKALFADKDGALRKELERAADQSV
jgi:hypothetical protein